MRSTAGAHTWRALRIEVVVEHDEAARGDSGRAQLKVFDDGRGVMIAIYEDEVDADLIELSPKRGVVRVLLVNRNLSSKRVKHGDVRERVFDLPRQHQRIDAMKLGLVGVLHHEGKRAAVVDPDLEIHLRVGPQDGSKVVHQVVVAVPRHPRHGLLDFVRHVY